RLKNSSGLSSPGSQMTVSREKPRLRASSAVDLTTNVPTPLPCASAETFIRQMQLRNSSSWASASKFAMMKASTSPSLSTTTRDQLVLGSRNGPAIAYDTGAMYCSCPGFIVRPLAATTFLADSSSSLNSSMDSGYRPTPFRGSGGRARERKYLDIEIT